MKNFKKPETHSRTEGASNKNQINVLNPDDLKVKLQGKNWVNPREPNIPDRNLNQIKTIQTQNKEAALRKVAEEKLESRYFTAHSI
jgi:hypothetical protein